VRGNLPLDDLPEWLRGIPEIDKTIAVIAAADTSIDCVRTARRLQFSTASQDGATVGYYRGTESEIRAREDDLIHAKEGRRNITNFSHTDSFIGDAQGHVRQIEMQRMRSKPTPQPEPRLPSRLRIPIPGSNFIVPANRSPGHWLRW